MRLYKTVKRIYVQCKVLLNALKTTLSSLNIEFYGWKVGGYHNVAPKKFSGNQLPAPLGNSSKTDLKKKASIKNQKSPKIM